MKILDSYKKANEMETRSREEGWADADTDMCKREAALIKVIQFIKNHQPLSMGMKDKIDEILKEGLE